MILEAEMTTNDGMKVKENSGRVDDFRIFNLPKSHDRVLTARAATRLATSNHPPRKKRSPYHTCRSASPPQSASERWRVASRGKKDRTTWLEAWNRQRPSPRRT